MPSLAAAEKAGLERLKELAKENFVSSDQKLMQLARRKGIFVNPELAKQALQRQVGNQLFARAPRSAGQSAATEPGKVLQEDLIDFSKNTKNPGYGVVLTDVFTRKTYSEPVERKTAANVLEATKKILTEVPGADEDGDVEDVRVSTDQGKEFKKLQTIPGVSHWTKVNGEINSIAVVDRRIQAMKQMLGKDAAQTKGEYSWQDRLGHVTKALNDSYTSAVHGLPDDVGGANAQTFMVLQDNARKYQANKDLSDKRVRAIEAAGAYRPPIFTGGRSFKPGFGTVRELAQVLPGRRFVKDTRGRRNLLALAKPVEKGSEEAGASLTIQTKHAPRPRGLQKVAGKALTKQIPLAAGQPVEGPRHRVRLKVKAKAKVIPEVEKATSSKSPLEEPRESEGLSSSSTGPNLLIPKGTMSTLIAQQKATYRPNRTMAQIQAEAAEKKKVRDAEAAEQRRQKETAKVAEKARIAKIREESKALDKIIREQEKQRKLKP